MERVDENPGALSFGPLGKEQMAETEKVLKGG